MALKLNMSKAIVNNTFITLIPKVKTAQRLGDFKPISLCNVRYKIVDKTLANRLKKILPNISSPKKVLVFLAIL